MDRQAARADIDRVAHLPRRRHHAREVAELRQRDPVGLVRGEVEVLDRDRAGGLRGNRFFMQNGGFFSETTPIGSQFLRPATGRQPTIDFQQLP